MLFWKSKRNLNHEAAALLEHLIISGKYAPDVRPDDYMCLVIQDYYYAGGIDETLCEYARKAIVTKIFPRGTLGGYLWLTDPEWESSDDFKSYLMKCNWYWKLIRELRTA